MRRIVVALGMLVCFLAGMGFAPYILPPRYFPIRAFTLDINQDMPPGYVLISRGELYGVGVTNLGVATTKTPILISDLYEFRPEARAIAWATYFSKYRGKPGFRVYKEGERPGRN